MPKYVKYAFWRSSAPQRKHKYVPVADTYSVVRTINKAGAINVYGFYPNFLLLLQEKIRGEGFFQSFFAKASQPISIQNFSRSSLCVSLPGAWQHEKCIRTKMDFFVKGKERTGLLHS